MKLHLLAVGRRMPAWVEAGCADYARRMQGELSLRIQAVEAAKRGANSDIERIKRSEAEALQKAAPPRAHRIALDVRGQVWSTAQLAERLRAWLAGGKDVALFIGGADGLDPDFLAAADETWSLSPLTFPHGLARLIVVEQLYRAFSLLRNHPYHRE